MTIIKHLNYVAGADFAQQTRVLLERDHHPLSLNRGEIHQLQESRLREMLAYAVQHSSWYRERLKHLDISRFTLADLALIPTMNKRELMDNWDDIVTNPQLKCAEAGDFLMNKTDYSPFHDAHVFASGGSSGRRGMFVWHADELATTLAGIYRYIYRDEFRHTDGNQPCRVMSIGALKPVHLSETVFAFPIVPAMESRAVSASAPIHDMIAELNEYQPTHLNGYPSAIARLAHQALKKTLAISPRRIMVGAEPLLDHMVKIIKEAWPEVKLCNQWGSTDAGVHAASCDYSGSNLHINEDLVIIEPVNSTLHPVAQGTKAAKILITNLYRKSMPVFRYEMDDAITMVDDVCPCGSHYQLIRSISGRSEDDFVYGDVTVTAEVFENVIMPDPAVDEYQVFQTANGATISIVASEGKSVNIEKMQSSLIPQLDELGLNNAIVHINLVKALERHPETCKLVRFNTLKKQQHKQL